MTLSYSKLFTKYLQDYLLLLQALVILEMRYINKDLELVVTLSYSKLFTKYLQDYLLLL